MGGCPRRSLQPREATGVRSCLHSRCTPGSKAPGPDSLIEVLVATSIVGSQSSSLIQPAKGRPMFCMYVTSATDCTCEWEAAMQSGKRQW